MTPYEEYEEQQKRIGYFAIGMTILILVLAIGFGIFYCINH